MEEEKIVELFKRYEKEEIKSNPIISLLSKYGKTEFIVVIFTILTSLGVNPSNITDPKTLQELVKQLNGLEPNSPVFYLVIAYVVIRFARKWQKDHAEIVKKKLELENKRLELDFRRTLTYQKNKTKKIDPPNI